MIDLGFEGGDAHGKVVAGGLSEEVVKTWRKSETARVLKDYLTDSRAY